MDKGPVAEDPGTVMVADAIGVVANFDSRGDGLAQKSCELVIQLLSHTASPFSRRQFTPGHITCTALVLHPDEPKILVMLHHRLDRWLLPGGHVEEADSSLAAAAAREALEETMVSLDRQTSPTLAGIDVHGIPPKKDEPFHLHHDLIWCFRASSAEIEVTAEAPQVHWAPESDWDRLGLAQSIRNAAIRGAGWHPARDW